MSPRRRTRRAATKAKTAPLPERAAGERLWVLDIPYGEPAGAAKWHAGVKAHLWVGAVLPESLRPYQSQPYTYPRLLEDTLNGSPGPPPAPAPQMQPRAVQLEAVRAIANHWQAGGHQFLLADDPGVGKTLSAVLAAKVIGKLVGRRCNILVIADRPASITIGHWCRTINAATDGGHQWCVTTWDRLGKVSGLPWDVVIADEVHMVRHQTTQRWRHWEKVSGFSRSSGPKPYLLVLSATPSHTPLETGYMAAAYADIHGGTSKAILKDFPGFLSAHGLHIEKGRYGATWTEDARLRAQDTHTARQWLTHQNPPAMLHRAAPWGPCPVSGMPVTLTPGEWASYEAAWSVFCQEMLLARRGSDTAKGRAALLRFRQKAGMLRVGATVEWVASQVESGRQVAVSCEFIETAADPIAEGLEAKHVRVARIYGQGRYDPERQRLLFQTGACPVVVFTPSASLSLHASEQLGDGTRASAAPRVGVFHQARYSGIQGRQIVGRTHRDHQTSPWKIAYAENTVEEQVAAAMVTRYAATAEQVGGDAGSLSEVARMLGADWLPTSALTDSS